VIAFYGPPLSTTLGTAPYNEKDQSRSTCRTSIPSSRHTLFALASGFGAEPQTTLLSSFEGVLNVLQPNVVLLRPYPYAPILMALSGSSVRTSSLRRTRGSGSTVEDLYLLGWDRSQGPQPFLVLFIFVFRMYS
jgi:hypothetical protein